MTSETTNAAFEIRPASRIDIPIIARLSRDYIEYGLPWRWRPSTLARCMNDACTDVVAAFDGSRILGFCAASTHDQTHVLLLAIRPRFRRQGIARALLGWVRRSSALCGVQQITVELRVRNRAALALYHSLGFTVIEEIAGYYAGLENAYRMRLQLTSPDARIDAIEASVSASLRHITRRRDASKPSAKED